MNLYIVQFLIYCCFYSSCVAWGDPGKVKIKHIEVLTLYDGRLTTARRSNPVPQLKCIGGTAGCGTERPRVVQCYNRGSDGRDVQWECKAEVKANYRFGTTEVTCEGYDYPDDPYVLKGSCGLEYTLDLVDYDSPYYNRPTHAPSKRSESLLRKEVLVPIAAVIAMYAIYRICLRGALTPGDGRYSEQVPPRTPGSFYGMGPSAPPPPGFRDEYHPSSSCDGTYGRSNTGSFGGFWSGSAVGGLAGYLLGSSRWSVSGFIRPLPLPDRGRRRRRRRRALARSFSAGMIDQTLGIKDRVFGRLKALCARRANRTYADSDYYSFGGTGEESRPRDSSESTNTTTLTTGYADTKRR